MDHFILSSGTECYPKLNTVTGKIDARLVKMTESRPDN